MIVRLFRRKSDDQAFALYGAIVAQARQPDFYARLSVPDSVEGRFDMIVLHMVMIFHRLKDEGPVVAEQTQVLFDLFLSDMDRSLREMGVGDLTVPKKMKKLAAAFYGRLASYTGALDAGDTDTLAATFARVFHEGTPPVPEDPERLARYAVAAFAGLGPQTPAEILAGRIRWPDPAQFAGA